jgi:hypothetical protein
MQRRSPGCCLRRRIRFPAGYARDALNSYFVFQTLKEQGVLPPHLRFQVSVPMVNSVLPPRIFPDQNDLAKIRPDYEAAMRAELSTIIEKSRHRTLRSSGTAQPRSRMPTAAFPVIGWSNLTEVRNLAPHIPPGVALGYHFCFGTLGGWPRFRPDDLGQAVQLANGFVAASGRKVDWIHLPVLDRDDDAFFAPLRNLEPYGGRVYLGMTHNMSNFKSRLQIARKYLPDFGLGGYCGFGRVPVSQLPSVLADHFEAMKIARAIN